MRKTVLKRAKSNKGASFAMAMLLFLACCVIGAVVLAAGTASAGRVSRMAEMDKRYYSVTSAAGLFRDLIDGRGYTVVRTKTLTVTDTETVTLDASGNTVGLPVDDSDEATAEPEYTHGFTFEKRDGSQLPFGAGTSVLADAVLNFVYGGVSDLGTAAAWNAVPGNACTKSLTLETDNDDVLPIEVTLRMLENGSILAAFSNADGPDVYTLTLTITAAVSDDSFAPVTQTLSEKSTSSEDILDSGNSVIGHTVTTSTMTTTVQTKTTSVKWSVGGISKEVAGG